MIALQVAAFVTGVVWQQAIVRSAVRTVVVPQGEQARLTRQTFLLTRVFYDFFAKHKHTLEGRERVLARYAPMTLLVLAGFWVLGTVLAFVLLYWSVGNHSLLECFYLSGSSITTLGFRSPIGLGESVLAFVEAIIGLAFVALLISYLPTIYSLFSQREAEVVKLDVRAGSPPTALEMLTRFHRINWLHRLSDSWTDWEVWFSFIEESHSTHPALVHFRSQRPNSSWITASGALLDSAAIAIAALDVDAGPQAAVTLRSGFMALQRIAGYFNLDIDAHPEPNAPISIYKEEFFLLLDDLEAVGVPLKPDREQAWRDFAGWRVNYDFALGALCALCEAPATPWSSDRVQRFRRPTLFHHRWRIEPLDNPPSW